MADEQRPAKKVVKKVVKKTVVRPVPKQPSSPRSTARRPGRPARPKASAAARPPKKSSPKKSSPIRPSLDLGSRVGSIRNRGVGAARGAGDRVRGGFDSVGDGLSRSVGAVRSARLPHLAAWQAAVITGVLVGLVSVSLGWASAALFTATRGTANGGNWGALALVVVAFVAFALGELLLDGFGVEQPRVTSFLGVIIVFVVILLAFLDLAQGRAAWVLVPVLFAVALVASERLMSFASDQPTQL